MHYYDVMLKKDEQTQYGKLIKRVQWNEDAGLQEGTKFEEGRRMPMKSYTEKIVR